jgi:DNA-binding MarR family transcriptional regulator
VTQHYEASFRGTGLRATQFTVLATLAQTGPMPLTTLANMLGLERTSLTRNLGPLQKRGFVSSAGNVDQRVRLIAITKEGEAAALAALEAWKQAQATVDDVLRETGIGKLFASRAG